MNKCTLALLIFLSTILPTFFVLPAYSASFDCNKASTDVEHLICANPELSKLDEELALHYQAEREDAKDNAYDSSKESRAKQIQWLTFQRNTCQDELCLTREYQERLGGQYTLGSVESFRYDESIVDRVYTDTYGNFLDPSVIENYDSKEDFLNDKVEEINGMFILSVKDRPYLAVIDGDKWFGSGYACMINNELAKWSQNHWVLNGIVDGNITELRIYPATYQGKPHILMKDIDGRYSHERCQKLSGGGYPIGTNFDGLVLERL